MGVGAPPWRKSWIRHCDSDLSDSLNSLVFFATFVHTTFLRHYSSMLFVLMSVEKCFAVYCSLKPKTASISHLCSTALDQCKTNSTECTNQAPAKFATSGTARMVTVSVAFLLLTAPTTVNIAVMQSF